MKINLPGFIEEVFFSNRCGSEFKQDHKIMTPLLSGFRPYSDRGYYYNGTPYNNNKCSLRRNIEQYSNRSWIEGYLIPLSKETPKGGFILSKKFSKKPETIWDTPYLLGRSPSQMLSFLLDSGLRKYSNLGEEVFSKEHFLKEFPEIIGKMIDMTSNKLEEKEETKGIMKWMVNYVNEENKNNGEIKFISTSDAPPYGAIIFQKDPLILFQIPNYKELEIPIHKGDNCFLEEYFNTHMISGGKNDFLDGDKKASRIVPVSFGLVKGVKTSQLENKLKQFAQETK